MLCNSCDATYINGVLCHEHECPDAWRNRSCECSECGCDFTPESRHQTVCNDCLNPLEPEYEEVLITFTDGTEDIFWYHEDQGSLMAAVVAHCEANGYNTLALSSYQFTGVTA